MGGRNVAVDAYIAKAAPFARPILRKLRVLFHRGCPPTVEKIKWGFPCFEHRGLLGGFAAFKQHVDFGFWKGKLLKDRSGYFAKRKTDSVLGMKLRHFTELPPDRVLLDWIRQAAALNEKGVKLPRQSKKARRVLSIPADLRAALSKNKKAFASFEGFSFTNRKEYVEWLCEAKREETRARRLETAIAWMEKGKPRNWKYMNCGVQEKQKPR